MNTNVLSGEQSNTKIVAVFKTKRAAEQCAQVLQQHGLDPNQLDVVGPNESHYDRKLEPEDQGVKRTAVKAHVRLGLVGFIIGWLIWGGLYFMGNTLVTSGPFTSLIPIVFVSTVAGLLWGGAVTMRPDHQTVVQTVDSAVHEGLWPLIIHSRSGEQTHLVRQTLSDLNIETTRSL